MKRLLALTALVALVPAASAAARPATEPPKKLDGNAVISTRGVGRSSSG